ncbi:hypothetical protein BKA70DRAFT_1369749 [Coprinopsis sp. MPI-PUGE-AT-0042]|nr:hypothetical protein BKA70DRAFT_1369749 [Coprinopsis sp. MPI-PUGE-AT-0042]
MPNVTVFVEDYSPLLIYGDGWSPGTAGDSSLASYSDSSYMTTQDRGELVSFVFTGLKVQLFGAKRPDYGQYEITANDTPYPARNASNETAVFQTSLWSFDWLNITSRTIKMINAGNNKAIDLDFVTWIFPLGDDDEEVITSTFEDTHPSFKYDSNTTWAPTTSNVARYSGGSVHVSSTAGSSFEFTFEGDAISLYGPVGPTGAPYTVTVDTDRLPTDFTTRKPAFHSNAPTVGATTQAEFAIDYAEVLTTPSLRGSRPLSAASGSDSSLSQGAVAGIVAGAFVGLLLLCGLLLLVIARRGRKNGRTFHIGFIEKDKRDEGPIRPFQYTDASPPSSPPGTTSGERLLQNQVSYASLSTSPTTAGLSPYGTQLLTAATMNDSVRPVSVISPTTQEVTVPSRGYEKSRPVQLQAPPQGQRVRQTPAANGAAGQSVTPRNRRSEMMRRQRGLSGGFANFGSAPPLNFSAAALVLDDYAISYRFLGSKEV